MEKIIESLQTLHAEISKLKEELDNNKWEFVKMHTNWFDLTRVLCINGDRQMEIAMGCQMCGYKYNSGYPCVVEASINAPLHYDEEITPRASNILKEFAKKHNMNELYNNCKNAEHSQISIMWQFDDKWD